MTFLRTIALLVAIFVVLTLAGLARSQTQAQPQVEAAHPAKCGPDHAILYKRAVGLLDDAEKKLTARYTAQAKAQVKEANSLFSTLTKECGPSQRQRFLSPKEEQQEAINQKLSTDEQSQADRLLKSAEDKEKTSVQIEAQQPELSMKYQKEARDQYEQAHKRYIKAQIYALRNQQMVFRFLVP